MHIGPCVKPAYRLYRLDADDHVTCAEDLAAPDDVTAIMMAAFWAGQSTAEVWSRTRLVYRHACCPSAVSPTEMRGRAARP